MGSVENTVNLLLHYTYMYTNFHWTLVVLGASFWFIALFIPLDKYDLGDFIAAITYVSFFVFFGVVALIVVPAEKALFSTMSGTLMAINIFGVVAYLRWVYSKVRQRRKGQQNGKTA